MSAQLTGDQQPPNPNSAVPIPPEERFWQRYSPHHEFPLSSVASVCLYGFGVLLAWAVVMFAMKRGDDYKPLPAEPIRIAGGGGNIAGQGNEGAGDRPVAPKDVVHDVKPEAAPGPNVAKNLKFDEVTPDPLTLPEIKERSSRIIEDSNSAVAALSHVSADARKQLFRGLGSVSKGQGGPGEGGGKGSGKGPGEGSGQGPGRGGSLNAREKRVLRWKMIFNTFNGSDYLTQLRELGAILAIPDPRGGGYLVIRDLRHLPAQGRPENLDDIKRIFWIDNKPSSVAALSGALGLRETPPHIIAFFPESLEKELLEKELKYRGRREDQIKETQFRVVRRGRGSYEPVVERQE